VSLRFRRSIRIAPGIPLNLGLHGAGLSVGPRALNVGMQRRGMYTNAGIPGTGIHAVHHARGSSGDHASVTGNAGGFVGILIAVAVIAIAAPRRIPLEMMWEGVNANI